MEMLAALKRAASLAKKGEMIAIMPPVGGLPSKVAVKKAGWWVSWLLDEEVAFPGLLIEVGALRDVVKGRGLSMVVIQRHNDLPMRLEVQHYLGEYGYAGCTPMLQMAEWFPPYPLTELKPYPSASDLNPEKMLAKMLHAVQSDPIRPELSCLCFAFTGVYAGDEAQFARGDIYLLGVAPADPCLVPADAFDKWPEEPFQYFLTSERIYFRLGDELRVADRHPSRWWPVDPVEHALQAVPEMWIDGSRKALVDCFKGARKLSDRRLVALGTEGGHLWMEVAGERTVILASSTHSFFSASAFIEKWRVVLDGNRLLDVLKALDETDVRIAFNAFDPRAPVRFEATGFRELLYPMLVVDEKSP